MQREMFKITLELCAFTCAGSSPSPQNNSTIGRYEFVHGCLLSLCLKELGVALGVSEWPYRTP